MSIKNRQSRSDILFNIGIYTASIMIFIVVLFPLLFILAASFSNPDLVNNGEVYIWPKGFTLLGYAKTFSYRPIWIGYLNTIIYTIVGTFISVVFTITTAYPLSRKDFYGNKLFTAIIMFTMFFSGGMIPTYLLVRNLHMLDTIWAITIPSAIGVWNVIITRTFFVNTIPKELQDAASIDGCTNIVFLMKIVLPLSTAVIGVISLYYAVWHWNSYFSALIYLNDENKYPLQLVLRSLIVQLTQSDQVIDDTILYEQRRQLSYLIRYCAITVAAIPLLIVYPFVQKYFVKGVMIGSVKG